MKTSYTISLVLAITAVMLFTALPCRAVEKEQEDIWSEDEPMWGHRRFELTDEAIERMMAQIEKTNPEEAKELAQLREKNPDEFKEVMRDKFHEKFRKHRQFELTDEAAERMLAHLAKTNPEKAKELEKLRNDEPEKFKAELRKAMQEQFDRRMREYRRHRTDRERPGRPGDPGGPDRPGEPHRDLEREMIRHRLHEKHDEYLEWLEKNYPEQAKKLAELKEEKPELYLRKIGLSLKKYGKIMEASIENPQLAEVLKEDLALKEKRDELLGKIRAASDDNEKKKLVKELEEVVGNRFDVIVKQKQIEYEQLRKKLNELEEQVKQNRAEVEKWKDAKNEQVKKRVEELISRTEKFRWD